MCARHSAPGASTSWTFTQSCNRKEGWVAGFWKGKWCWEQSSLIPNLTLPLTSCLGNDKDFFIVYYLFVCLLAFHFFFLFLESKWQRQLPPLSWNESCILKTQEADFHQRTAFCKRAGVACGREGRVRVNWTSVHFCTCFFLSLSLPLSLSPPLPRIHTFQGGSNEFV